MYGEEGMQAPAHSRRAETWLSACSSIALICSREIIVRWRVRRLLRRYGHYT